MEVTPATPVRQKHQTPRLYENGILSDPVRSRFNFIHGMLVVLLRRQACIINQLLYDIGIYKEKITFEMQDF